jgi:hypothetical protein
VVVGSVHWGSDFFPMQALDFYNRENIP